MADDREDSLQRELDDHLELMAQERRDQGESDETARRAARRRLGSLSVIREDVRALSPLAAWSDAIQDFRYGLRLLLRRPGFAAAAALTLAIGVGATTTVFSVIQAVLLRPLPYADADRLAMVWEDVKQPTYTNARNSPAPGNFRDWRAQNSSFMDLAAIRSLAVTLTGRGDPLRVEAAAVSASLFRLLGARPAAGREFTADEDRAVPSRVALLGHDLWVDRFGSDPAIVGRNIQLNDVSFLVAGVMPASFHFPDADVQIWMPLQLTPEQLSDHGGHFLRVVGRLKPGVTFAQAQADLLGIAARLTVQFPRSNQGVSVVVVPLTEQIVGDIRRPLLLIGVVVGFLLLMVCTNIGNLLLARASARRQEFAVRAALGASRTRLLRQLLAEGALLAAGGGIAGLLFAWSGLQALRWLAPSDLPRLDELSIDSGAATFNAGIALAAGMLCSLAPALRASTPVDEDLRGEGRMAGARSSIRTRNALVAVQVALSVVVLVGAGLLLQSFVQLTRIPVGFRPDGVLTFRVGLPGPRYRTIEQRIAFYEQLTARLNALPGASSAAGISFLPLTMSGRSTGISIDDDTAPGQVRMVDFRSVSPGYFGAMSIPIRAGRDVDWSDSPTAPPAVIVSETAARTFWPGQNPIGRRLKRGRPEDTSLWLTVVGVVADVRQLDLVKVPRPAMYFAASQDPGTGDTLRDWVVRAPVEPAALAAPIRQAVAAVDATLPVTHVRAMAEWQAAATATQQFTLSLVSVFAAIALVLAAIGLYGVTAFSVAQRSREFGIRIALGARPGGLVANVLTHGARLAATGLASGIVLALALTRLMATQLYEIGPRDPATFAAVTALILVVSLAASFVPAFRVTRVQPIAVLRS
jgi:putative ABC transport system permease protein